MLEGLCPGTGLLKHCLGQGYVVSGCLGIDVHVFHPTPTPSLRLFLWDM